MERQLNKNFESDIDNILKRRVLPPRFKREDLDFNFKITLDRI